MVDTPPVSRLLAVISRFSQLLINSTSEKKTSAYILPEENSELLPITTHTISTRYLTVLQRRFPMQKHPSADPNLRCWQGKSFQHDMFVGYPKRSCGQNRLHLPVISGWT